MKEKVGLCTLGCKVSQYETEAIAEAFAERGYRISDYDGVCDIYVINTCTVTAESDRKSRQMIRRALRRNPDALVMVTGCYSQIRPAEVAAIAGVAYVSGSDRKMAIVDRAEELLSDRSGCPIVEVGNIADAAFESMRIRSAPRTRAYVKIEDGCECRCTYCTIPMARGSVRSRPPREIIEEVSGLLAGGTREIVLTGIETASYGADFENYDLIDLLRDLAREALPDRIRFGSLSPEMMTPRRIEALAEIPHITPHFHLSMQSGSDAVLRAMRRRYLSGQALDSLRRIRACMPSVQFTTDMLVGFPGESEEHFAETEAFCREARFLRMHVFPYSRRQGTPAADFPGQVPEEEKRRRTAELIRLDGEIRAEILASAVGRRLSVLFETCTAGMRRGHSDEFFDVLVPGSEDLHGQILPVTVTGFSDGVLLGRLADSN